MKENHRILGGSSSRSLDNDNNHVVVQLCNGLRTRKEKRGHTADGNGRFFSSVDHSSWYDTRIGEGGHAQRNEGEDETAERGNDSIDELFKAAME